MQRFVVVLAGGAINGIMVPAGTMTVYDQVMGKNAKRPFLHVRYRESQAESRQLQNMDDRFSWWSYDK